MRYHLALAAVLVMQTSAVHAENIAALIGEDILATIDSQTARTTNLVKIDGVGAILGIDVRPADGRLYALASDGTIATIEPSSGKATAKSRLDKLPLADVQVAVDFNPVADKMRIIGADGTNLRADVDNGKVTEDQPLKFAASELGASRKPMIVAAAYSNSLKGAKETTLYDIDAGLASLFRQAPPNDGVLNTIGKLGVTLARFGFDIVADAAGNNTGMLVTNGKLYTLDLTTGVASGGKSIVGLPSDVRDIAVLPSAAGKQAANTATGGADTSMRAGADMGSRFVPEPMPTARSGDIAKPMPLNSGLEAPKTLQSRTGYGMHKDAYSGPKMKRVSAPQCNERRAQN